MVSWRRFRIKRIRERSIRIKVRRVGRSPQTESDADHEPFRAQRRCRVASGGFRYAACHGCIPAAPTAWIIAHGRSANRRCHPRRRKSYRPLPVFAGKMRDLPMRALDLRVSRRRRGRLGVWRCSALDGCGICARPMPPLTRANARSLVDDWISNPGYKRLVGPPRRRAGAPRDLAAVSGAAGARRHRRQNSTLPALPLRGLTREIRYLRYTMLDIPDGVTALEGC